MLTVRLPNGAVGGGGYTKVGTLQGVRCGRGTELQNSRTNFYLQSENAKRTHKDYIRSNKITDSHTVLVSFLRVTTIADRLETSSAAVVQRLAGLEKQVVTPYVLITDVAPVSVIHTMHKRDDTLCNLFKCLPGCWWKIDHLHFALRCLTQCLTHF